MSREEPALGTLGANGNIGYLAHLGVSGAEGRPRLVDLKELATP